MSGTTNAAIAAAFASVSFGAAAAVTRFVIGDIEPVPLAFLRYLIASLLLAGTTWRSGNRDVLPMVSRIVAWAAVIDGIIALGRFVRVS